MPPASGIRGGIVPVRFAETFRVRSSSRAAVPVLAFLLLACGPAEEPAAPEIRPVRTVTIETTAGGEPVSITGRIEAEDVVNLSFRVGQRLLERSANLGDRLAPGQLVARLDRATLENAVQAAQASLSAAQATATDARLEFERQRSLLARGVAARAVYERATAARDSAAAQVQAAQAQLATAREQLSYTDLYADSAGDVTAVGAEPGEVVAAGQMIVRVAREGGLDAVFAVPARVRESAAGLDPEVAVALTADPNVRTVGRVREISPQADPVTRTFEVKVGLTEPPAAMRLGSTVTGTIHLGEGVGIRIPSAALTRADGSPAVFVFDPDSSTVSLRPVAVESHGLAETEISQGLEAGEIVVTAGVQTLRPGQEVRRLQDAP